MQLFSILKMPSDSYDLRDCVQQYSALHATPDLVSIKVIIHASLQHFGKTYSLILYLLTNIILIAFTSFIYQMLNLVIYIANMKCQKWLNILIWLISPFWTVANYANPFRHSNWALIYVISRIKQLQRQLTTELLCDTLYINSLKL